LAALPLLGYVQYLGDCTEAVAGIMPLYCVKKGDLPWSLTILSKVEKKFCVPKEL
jgi:hypothetical protein